MDARPGLRDPGVFTACLNCRGRLVVTRLWVPKFRGLRATTRVAPTGILKHSLLALIHRTTHHSRLNPDLLNQHRLFRAVKRNRFCAGIVDPFLFDRQRGKRIQYFVAVGQLAEIGVFTV